MALGASFFSAFVDARAMQILNRTWGGLIFSLGVYAMWGTLRA